MGVKVLNRLSKSEDGPSPRYRPLQPSPGAGLKNFTRPALNCDGYRTDAPARRTDNLLMPHYSYSLEDGVPIADLEAKEKFTDNRAAIEHAKQIAKDLARSLVARRGLRVVVRNEAGAEIGAVSLVENRP